MLTALSLNEKDFLLAAIKSHFRVDARGVSHFRHLDIRFGQENGQTLLKVGRTKILTSSSLKLVSPQEGKSKEGFFKFNVELNALLPASESLGANVQELRFDIAQFIDKVVKCSRATDRESLCIVQGRLVWSVQVDLFLLNDDGNLFDAFFLAAVLALLNTRLPEVTVSKERIRVNSDKLKPLNVHHIPICTSFYFIENTPVVDTTAKEEKLATARLSIVMNIFEDLCGMTTLGSLEIDPLTILECSRVALAKSQEITKLVRERFAARHTLLAGVLDLQEARVSKPSQIRQQNKRSAQDFLNSLSLDIESSNSQVKGMPLRVDEAEQEEQLVALIRQKKHEKKKNKTEEAVQLEQSKESPSRKSGSDMRKVEIESSERGALSLTSALKSKRNKK